MKWKKEGFSWKKYDEDGKILALIIEVRVVKNKVSYLGEFHRSLKIKILDYIQELYVDNADLLKLKMDLILIENGYKIDIPGL